VSGLLVSCLISGRCLPAAYRLGAVGVGPRYIVRIDVYIRVVYYLDGLLPARSRTAGFGTLERNVADANRRELADTKEGDAEQV
jgi:hypothetical protein